MHGSLRGKKNPGKGGSKDKGDLGRAQLLEHRAVIMTTHYQLSYTLILEVRMALGKSPGGSVALQGRKQQRTLP